MIIFIVACYKSGLLQLSCNTGLKKGKKTELLKGCSLLKPESITCQKSVLQRNTLVLQISHSAMYRLMPLNSASRHGFWVGGRNCNTEIITKKNKYKDAKLTSWPQKQNWQEQK